MGRKPKLTPHQRSEALVWREAGEATHDIGRSYNVAHTTISRLGRSLLMPVAANLEYTMQTIFSSRMFLQRTTAFMNVMLLVTTLTNCDRNTPTTPRTQADANRIISLCGGGYSSRNIARLTAAYTKSSLNVDAAYTEEARGIIFSDTSMKALDGAQQERMYNAFIACVKETKESEATHSTL